MRRLFNALVGGAWSLVASVALELFMFADKKLLASIEAADSLRKEDGRVKKSP